MEALKEKKHIKYTCKSCKIVLRIFTEPWCFHAAEGIISHTEFISQSSKISIDDFVNKSLSSSVLKDNFMGNLLKF